MDFDGAARRLARDQQKIRGRKPVVVSEQAKKQAEFQRKQRAKLQEEKERIKRHHDYQKQQFRSWERSLYLKSLGGGNSSPSGQLLLQPTSIHGTGDKLSLPPSVLETLTAELGESSTLGNPWTFRIGILNSDYQFPSSPLIQTLQPPFEFNGDDGDMAESDDDDDDDQDGTNKFVAYLDELAHKYIAYTHCSVVEFTQEEGHVGIPQHIASALLDPQNRHAKFVQYHIPTLRTVDPAKSSHDSSSGEIVDGDVAMQQEEDPTTATPGHVAYGAFDVPDVCLEISLVTLPKGKGCTLVPTEEAVRRGFYLLKDVKLVLEQSLIRTRATLSMGDVVSTWHRGVQFDLQVTQVLPSDFGAVTCINTDIEVDLGETTLQDEPKSNSNSTAPPPSLGRTLGSGSVVGSSSGPSSNVPDVTDQQPLMSIELCPEPPLDQTENIFNVQIRYSGGNGKRRFDVHRATVQDLFDFAASLLGSNNPSSFRLVTRFPRTVYSMQELPTNQTLAQVGIHAGQELFMVEMM